MPNVYFDMDGVLVNFNKFAYTHFPDLMRVPGTQTFFWDTINTRCGTDFWADLEPIQMGLDLLTEIQKLPGVNTCVLTAIPNYDGTNANVKENARVGKIKWVADHIGDIPFLMTRRREKINYCVDRHSVLIDDFSKTVDEWNACGGLGILFDQRNPEMKELVLEKFYDFYGSGI